MKVKNTHFVIDEWDFIDIFEEGSYLYDRYLSDCDGYSTEISIQDIDNIIEWDSQEEEGEREVTKDILQSLRDCQKFIRELASKHNLQEKDVHLVLLRG